MRVRICDICGKKIEEDEKFYQLSVICNQFMQEDDQEIYLEDVCMFCLDSFKQTYSNRKAGQIKYTPIVSRKQDTQ